MAFIFNFAKGVRTHWKKSLFASVALTYAGNYTKEYYLIQELMRDYCEKASKYGNEPIRPNESLRNVTVILNPNANKRKATKDFDKYCAPILHLAGICIDIVQTESEGHARTLSQSLDSTDAIIVAGGDGTLSEVITGLMRKNNSGRVDIPIGVLPLGCSNTLSKRLFPGDKQLQLVRSLADASLAVIERRTQPIDVMKIEVIDEEHKGDSKPVYAVSGFEWGPYRDAQAKKDKYWVFGPLRNYVTYLFNGYDKNASCEADIHYTLPCPGCTHCCKVNRRWYHWFLPYQPSYNSNHPVLSNDHCKDVYERSITASDLALVTEHNDAVPKLKLDIGPSSVDYLGFVRQGWKTESGSKRRISETIEAKEITIKPITKTDPTHVKWFSIDKEEFEVKAVKITLLPKAINMFCK